jgi:hypothetical protein
MVAGPRQLEGHAQCLRRCSPADAPSASAVDPSGQDGRRVLAPAHDWASGRPRARRARNRRAWIHERADHDRGRARAPRRRAPSGLNTRRAAALMRAVLRTRRPGPRVPSAPGRPGRPPARAAGPTSPDPRPCAVRQDSIARRPLRPRPAPGRTSLRLTRAAGRRHLVERHGPDWLQARRAARPVPAWARGLEAGRGAGGTSAARRYSPGGRSRPSASPPGRLDRCGARLEAPGAPRRASAGVVASTSRRLPAAAA